MNYVSLKILTRKIVLFIVLSHTIILSQPKIVVFDLGGVLFQTKTPISILLRHITLKTVLTYLAHPYTQKYHLKKMTLTFLDKIKQRDQQKILSHLPIDEHGNPLPLLMEEWLAGTISCNEIMTFIKTVIKNNSSLFSCAIEKRIILKIIRLIFDPVLFTETQQLHPDAIKSIQKLKTDGFQVYALSNWDKESFLIMKEKHNHLFSLFDGIMISGEEGLTKPSPLLYNAFLSKYNLDADSCIFIDDQIVNVTAAKAIGMHALLCPYQRSMFIQRKANLVSACKAIVKTHKKIINLH